MTNTLLPARLIGLALACAGALAAACVSPAPLDHRPCACAPGWACCEARAICVRPDELAGCGPDAGGAASDTPHPIDAAVDPPAPESPAPDGPAADVSSPDTDPGGRPDGPTALFVLPPDGARVQGSVRLARSADGLRFARLELWVDGELRVTAAGDANAIAWPAFRETLGAHPKAVHRIEAVAVDGQGRRFTEGTRVFVVAPVWGDCDSDGVLGAGDATAVQSEACDGDPLDPESTPEGDYLGSPACDVNADNMIDLADEDCVNRALHGAPPGACAPAELPTVRTVVFLPDEDHGLADDPALRELMRNKVEEARRYFARNNGGLTFRASDVEIFKAPQGRGYYRDDLVINYENVLDALNLPGYIEPTNRVLTPWNRVLWVFVAGGTDSVVVDRFPNGHAYALVGDALLAAARDLDCSRVNPVLRTDPVKDTCRQVWLASGNPYGYTMGRAVKALAQALGAAPLPADAPGWSQSLMGDYRGYPRVGLGDAERAVFGRSPFFPGSRDLVQPEVTIFAPAAGATITAPLMIRATARDDVGVRDLLLEIDGQRVTEAAVESPFDGDLQTVGLQLLWDPAKVAPGIHQVSVIAFDTSGNVGSMNLNVTVVR
jgi:hypothetical protein